MREFSLFFPRSVACNIVSVWLPRSMVIGGAPVMHFGRGRSYSRNQTIRGRGKWFMLGNFPGRRAL